jgi:hypothetical protein
MALEVRISGAQGFKDLARQIRAEGRKDLSRQLDKALAETVVPVEKSIRLSSAETMPKGGGYAGEMSRSLRFRTQKRTGGNSASYSLLTYADGKAERRDIRALEAGNLRHPVHGNRKVWALTKIREGFHKRGTDNAADEAVKRMDVVVREYAARLIK